MAAMTALLIGLVAGPAVRGILTSLKIGQPIRGYAMQSHLSKSGTPTMGGVLILLSIAISTCCGLTCPTALCGSCLIVTLGFWRHWLRTTGAGGQTKTPRACARARSTSGKVGDRPHGRAVSGVQHFRKAPTPRWGAVCGLGAVGLLLTCPRGLQPPFFKEVSYPLGVLGFVILTTWSSWVRAMR